MRSDIRDGPRGFLFPGSIKFLNVKVYPTTNSPQNSTCAKLALIHPHRKKRRSRSTTLWCSSSGSTSWTSSRRPPWPRPSRTGSGQLNATQRVAWWPKKAPKDVIPPLPPPTSQHQKRQVVFPINGGIFNSSATPTATHQSSSQNKASLNIS